MGEDVTEVLIAHLIFVILPVDTMRNHSTHRGLTDLSVQLRVLHQSVPEEVDKLVETLKKVKKIFKG